MEEVAPGVIRILDKFVNCYILVDKGTVFLLDTGLPSTVKLITQTLGKSGHSPADIQTILITHADGDHFGGLSGIQKLSHALALANPIEAEAIRLGKSSRKLTPNGLLKVLMAVAAPLFKAPPAVIDSPIENGQVFPVLGGLQAYFTPGHTPGHMSFFAADRGILFAGDSINLKDNQPVPSSGGNTWDLSKANQSFELQMALKPHFIFAGHCVWKDNGN